MLNLSTRALFVFAVISASVPSGANAESNGPNQPSGKSPAGFIMVEEDAWNKLADEPDLHMQRAREAYVMMDARTAAAEIRKAAVYLRISAGHAADRTKEALVRSEHEMEHLARQLESGAVRSVEEIDHASSRALHSLSDYQYVKAADAWRRRETRQSGQYLRAAADNLERSAVRTTATLRAATAEVTKDTRMISGRLVEGTGFVIDEVGNGLESFGHQIERVGKGLAPVTAARPKP